MTVNGTRINVASLNGWEGTGKPRVEAENTWRPSWPLKSVNNFSMMLKEATIILTYINVHSSTLTDISPPTALDALVCILIWVVFAFEHSIAVCVCKGAQNMLRIKGLVRRARPHGWNYGELWRGRWLQMGNFQECESHKSGQEGTKSLFFQRLGIWKHLGSWGHHRISKNFRGWRKA